MELRYPRIVHSELLTHRRASRNSASSRAIPIDKMLSDIERDPFIPIHWGKNQTGMQAYAVMTEEEAAVAREEWLAAMRDALRHARNLQKLGLHKQTVNRVVEPWMWITIVFSNTTAGWANFFALRCHEKAEPHINKIANMAKAAISKSTPNKLAYGQWHLPLIGFAGDEDIPVKDLSKISAARCARVSYLTHNGVRDVEKDLDLYNKLVQEDPKHASALEHPAECIEYDPTNVVGKEVASRWSGNYEPGWCQLRKLVPRESVDTF